MDHLSDYEMELLLIILRKQLHILEEQQHSSDVDLAAESAYLRRKTVDLLEVINPKHTMH